MMPKPEKSYRCRYCGRDLHAWLAAATRPNAPLLLDHLAARHPGEAMPYLKSMETEGIAPVVLEAYERIEGDAPEGLMDPPLQVPRMEPPPPPETVEVYGHYLPVEKSQTYVLQQRTSKRYAIYRGAGMNNYISVQPVGKKTERLTGRPPFWTHASGWAVVGIAHLSVVFQPPPPPATSRVGKFFERTLSTPGRELVRIRVDRLEFWSKEKQVDASNLWLFGRPPPHWKG
jgi:hypothetical protein